MTDPHEQFQAVTLDRIVGMSRCMPIRESDFKRADPVFINEVMGRADTVIFREPVRTEREAHELSIRESNLRMANERVDRLVYLQRKDRVWSNSVCVIVWYTSTTILLAALLVLLL